MLSVSFLLITCQLIYAVFIAFELMLTEMFSLSFVIHLPSVHLVLHLLSQWRAGLGRLNILSALFLKCIKCFCPLKILILFFSLTCA